MYELQNLEVDRRDLEDRTARANLGHLLGKVRQIRLLNGLRHRTPRKNLLPFFVLSLPAAPAGKIIISTLVLVPN